MNSQLKQLIEKIQEIVLNCLYRKTSLLTLIRSAHKNKLIDSDAFNMIEGVLALSKLKARDMMLSQSRLIRLSEDQSLTDIIDVISQSGHSRFPVTDEEQNTVVGILHAKDLLTFFKTNPDPDDFNIRDLLRPASFIPESKTINTLLKDFRSNRYHMAIVADEYGQPAGFITIEDILEKIVGTIEDEFDQDPDLFIREKKHPTYWVKASTPIQEFNNYFKCSLSDSEFDTFGGIIIHLFGHLPKIGETVLLNDLCAVTILESSKRRLDLLEVVLKAPHADMITTNA